MAYNHLVENILVKSSGALLFRGREYKCALGKGGVGGDKKEGDGKTPLGCFDLREVYFRADRNKRPETGLPVYEIKKDDGWCDDIFKKEYNRKIKLPFDGSYENLWREDGLYDLIAVLGYNDNPPVAGKGSAIFMHIVREGYTPTAGCVALAKEDLMEILKGCSLGIKVCITESS